MKYIFSLTGLGIAFAPATALAALGQNTWALGENMGMRNCLFGGGYTGAIASWFILIIGGLILVTLFVLLVALVQRVFILNSHHQYGAQTTNNRSKKPKKAKKVRAKKAKKKRK